MGGRPAIDSRRGLSEIVAPEQSEAGRGSPLLIGPAHGGSGAGRNGEAGFGFRTVRRRGGRNGVRRRPPGPQAARRAAGEARRGPRARNDRLDHRPARPSARSRARHPDRLGVRTVRHGEIGNRTWPRARCSSIGARSLRPGRSAGPRGTPEGDHARATTRSGVTRWGLRRKWTSSPSSPRQEPRRFLASLTPTTDEQKQALATAKAAAAQITQTRILMIICSSPAALTGRCCRSWSAGR